MIFQDRTSLDTPAGNFIVYKNTSGLLVLKGDPLILDTTTVPNGVNVRYTSVGLEGLFAGIAYGPIGTLDSGGGSIPDGAYCLLQVGGFCDYARVAAHASNNTLIGDILKPVAGQTYLQRTGAGDGRPAFVQALEAIAANAALPVAARKVWIGNCGS